MIDHRGIWPPYEAFYIQAMLFNTRSAAASIEWLSSAIEAISSDSSDDPFRKLDRTALLCELQNIILQAAALSRYFWPVRKGHDIRAEQLRNAFQIADDNPLKNRDLRNEIEHFDERLDAYVSGGIVGRILPEFVGLLPESDGVPTHLFRAYYIDAGLFETLGNRYDIEPIAEQILRVHELLLLADQDGRLGGEADPRS